MPINSSRSLHYLIENKAKSYTEKKITNNKAQHSKLHQRNPLVDQYLYDFLTGELQ
nr:alpha/beta hydrolase [Lactococcus piscium]